MSGFGAPARTAAPSPAVPISARVPATTLPLLIRASSTGGLSTATSKVSPASILRLSSALTSNRNATLWPLCRSNWATRSLMAERAPLPLSTLSSAAEAVVAASAVKMVAMRAGKTRRIFIGPFWKTTGAAPPPLPVGERERAVHASPHAQGLGGVALHLSLGEIAELGLGEQLLALERVRLDGRGDLERILVRHLHADALQPHVDRVDARALAHHHLGGRLADRAPAHREQLGRELLAAVLEPARDDPGLDLVERLAHDRLVARHRDAGALLHQARERRELGGVDADVDAVHGLERHHGLFHRRVAGTLADAEHRRVHHLDALGERHHGVGDAHAEILVEVRLEPLVDARLHGANE